MKLSEIMTTKVVSIGPSDDFDAAIALFDSHSYRYLPVIHRGALVGLLSRRELSLATGWLGAAHRKDKGPKDPKVIRDIMRDRVVTLGPHHGIETAASMMVGKRVGAIPILESNAMVGLVTSSDILGAIRGRNPLALWGRHPGVGAKVSEYMERKPAALDSSTDVAEAADICRRMSLRHVAVTHAGLLVGLVSEHELRFDLEEDRGPADQPLSEVMVTDLITIGPDEDLNAAADSMIEHHVSGLPVVCDRGLVGFLTDQDVIQHFTAKFRVPGM